MGRGRATNRPPPSAFVSVASPRENCRARAETGLLPPGDVLGYTAAMADLAHCACKTRRRWFRITPDRVVLGLLGVNSGGTTRVLVIGEASLTFSVFKFSAGRATLFRPGFLRARHEKRRGSVADRHL